MNTPLPLDAAALDRWSALLARIIDHSDGTRPFAEVYDDELEPFIAQARAALTLSARVAELEGELARAKWDVAARNAHANALRDALESGNRRLGYWCDLHGSLPEDVSALAGMQAALASTPAASLAAYRASVLEEAAKECEHGIPSGPTANEAEYGYNRGRAACASDIRAIAAHPANTGEVKP